MARLRNLLMQRVKVTYLHLKKDSVMRLGRPTQKGTEKLTGFGKHLERQMHSVIAS